MSGLAMQDLGETFFDYLHHDGRVFDLRLGDEKVEVLGHDHVSDNYEAVSQPCLLQNPQEQVAPLRGSQLRLAMIATTGNEVEVVSTVPALQALGHGTEINGEREVCL